MTEDIKKFQANILKLFSFVTIFTVISESTNQIAVINNANLSNILNYLFTAIFVIIAIILFIKRDKIKEQRANNFELMWWWSLIILPPITVIARNLINLIAFNSNYKFDNTLLNVIMSFCVAYVLFSLILTGIFSKSKIVIALAIVLLLCYLISFTAQPIIEVSEKFIFNIQSVVASIIKIVSIWIAFISIKKIK